MRLLVTIVMLVMCKLALAAREDLDYIYQLSIEELLQVKVTGSTLTPEELKTVPSAVSVFSRNEIKRLGLDSLDELMNLVPGFQSHRSSLSGLHFQISSRGRRIGNDGAEILIMVDGTRLASPRNSGSNMAAARFPLVEVERVEFIRGPGSAVYGSNAMMGVINIVTRTNEREISASFGSFDRSKGHIFSTHKFRDIKVDFFAQIDTDNGDEYRLLDPFTSNSIKTDDPRHQRNLNFKLNWRDTYVYLQHNQTKTENFYELDTVANGINERTGRLSSLALKQDFGWWEVDSSVWLGFSRSRFTTDSLLTGEGDLFATSSPASNDALSGKADFEEYDETRFQWHNTFQIKPESSLQFGLEFRHVDAPETIAANNFDLRDLANGVTPIRYYGTLLETTPVQANSQRDIVGIYSQLQHKLFDRTHLTLGLRHDDFSNIGSHLSPRLGLVYEINDTHSVKLLYGEAFRAPGESELNFLNNPFVQGNKNLNPETVKSSELIWVGQWRHTGLSLGFFESRFEDAIVQIVSGGTRVFSNEDQDPSKGFEFELTHELNDQWLIRSTYTHLTDSPELSFRESEEFGSLTVNYQRDNWNGNISAIYQSERELAALDSNGDRIELASYWQIYGKITYTFSEEWQGHIQVKNLLDEDFDTPTSGTSLTEGVPNRGREIFAELTWKF